MPRTRTELTRIIESLDYHLNPSTTNTEKPDSFTIKQPPGTRERVKELAAHLKVPFRDLAKACFEHGLVEVEAAYQKAAKRAARLADDQPMLEPTDTVTE